MKEPMGTPPLSRVKTILAANANINKHCILQDLKMKLDADTKAVLDSIGKNWTPAVSFEPRNKGL